MKPQLMNIREQVMVITGASSGIGLTTARMAAQQGASVVLAARDQNVLDRLCEEVESSGGKALAVATDVSRLEDVEALADKASERFGAFDTWVNNSGGSVYGSLLDIPVEEERKLFETNYWGVVYGSRVAAKHLQTRGGAIINLGSVASDRAIPLQAAYSASKHAVKAYTDALRTELEKEGAPVSVTLIKPTAIDTPFFRHAATHMDSQPIEPSPMYAPDAVARAILYAAQHPVRDILVGGRATMESAMGRLVPRFGDWMMRATMFDGQKSQRRPLPQDNQGLERASGELQERGNYDDATVLEHSLYTELAMRSSLNRAGAAGALLALMMIARKRKRNRADRRLSTGRALSVGARFELA